MIIEGLFTWLAGVLNYMVTLLPQNGTMFDSVKSVSFGIFKFMTVANGYIPVKEIITISGIYLLIAVAIAGIRVSTGVFNLVSKLIP